ncbi:unnamed protein product [Rotaria sp. Silwood2]|nr:unnamed protein product [Rotaria sp. Silwood2]CAF2947051.1 unnamed protein product [Rotaria sp. Silwood2]CAF3323802.1 unnamed protein product [Rotaria sp. Silwood2]CAF3939328.1 unnamed protein product [Rotaria sp. Silwood2]CAF4032193.1 unnamed protein product [Rotaria sp. Silwood2]
MLIKIDRNVLSLIECDNGKYYGMPIYKCIYVLVYHSDNKELSSVTTFEDLLEIASKRQFIMRKPGRALKLLNYLTLQGQKSTLRNITEENLNMNIINRLSHFYKYSKVLLNPTDCYSFLKFIILYWF